MTDENQTTEEMLAEIKQLGEKRMGDASQDEWLRYTALTQRCLKQMAKEATFFGGPGCRVTK